MPLEMTPVGVKSQEAKGKSKSKQPVKRPDPLASAYAAAQERQALAAAERLKVREAAAKAALDKKAYYDEVPLPQGFNNYNSNSHPNDDDNERERERVRFTLVERAKASRDSLRALAFYYRDSLLPLLPHESNARHL